MDVEVAEKVAACRAGDRDAYEWLVRRYARAVFAVCYGILGNAHDAEDLTQETLVKGFLQIKKLRQGQNFRAWIIRISRNLCIDLIRRRTRARQAPVRERGGEDERADFSALETALERLPEKYRQALVMYYLDAQSTDRVAETLNITPAAVRTRISRARQQLRKLLTEDRRQS